jgi:hypothetical protein
LTFAKLARRFPLRERQIQSSTNYLCFASAAFDLKFLRGHRGKPWRNFKSAALVEREAYATA